MLILPAIDIKDNKCVMLSQGKFNHMKVYYSNPIEVALKWQEEGANYLHLVDLNGSIGDNLINKKSIERIIKEVNIPVQVGGGIRDEKKVEEILKLGASRVIIGTVAVENMELLQKLIGIYGNEKIVVSIDAKDGRVATRGWETINEINSMDLCKILEEIGVRTVIYTDISKDGMLTGPNFNIYRKLKENTNLNIIASGGISSLEDVKLLKKLDLYGAIIGRAFYENILSYKEVIECL